MNDPLALWPANGVPLAVGTEAADIPTLTRFDPEPATKTGAAVVVCPGGGYNHLAEHEGTPIARWLTRHGITAFVLKYRLGPRYRHPSMLHDVSRAIRTGRHQADFLGLDAGRVGVLGFSAGGHLAATVSTQGEAGDPRAADPIDQQDARPNVSILLYPVISLAEGYSHGGSRVTLLGEAVPAELVQSLSAERRVTARTPPTFLFHTVNDPVVPIENALVYAAALRRAGVPFEMHLHERGLHGVGLAVNDPDLRIWPTLCINWLALRGFACRGD